MISLKNVSKWYGGFQVLTDCSTDVKKGEVVVVCGPSGSGKSTLIKCVNGLEPFQKGEITVDGISVGDPKTDLPKLRSRIGMVFQNFELFPHMSVTRNLTLAQVKVLVRTPQEATQKGLKLLERVGLAAHKDKYPGQLSGGQQQRVAIARALAMDPIAMLFDEPTSALDPEMINEVLDVMVELAREGMTMMVVTHEMGFARKVAHRVVFMDRGEIVEDALKDDFFGKPRSERAQLFLSKILQHLSLSFRRQHARPERKAPVRPVCPVGLYRAHIRIGLVALPEALPRRSGVRPVVRARRLHGRNGARGVAREPLERALGQPPRPLRLDRGWDRRRRSRLPRGVRPADPALARPGDPGARLSGRGRGLQVIAVRPADRPADRTARHDFPAPLRGGDPPRARGARPSSGDALLHELDRRGRRSARWRVPADRLARNAGHDAVRRSAQPRSRRGGPRHRTPGRACRRRRAALAGLGSVRELRRPPR